MKDFLIGLGIGFAIGAVMVKSNKDLSRTVDKSKQMVEDKVEMVKDMIADKNAKPKNIPPKKSAN